MYYKYFKRKENNPGFLLCVSNSRSKTFYCLGAVPMVYSVNVWSQALTGDKVMTSRLWFFIQKAKHGLEKNVNMIWLSLSFLNLHMTSFPMPHVRKMQLWCYFKELSDIFFMKNVYKKLKKILVKLVFNLFAFFFLRNRCQMFHGFHRNALWFILSLSS